MSPPCFVGTDARINGSFVQARYLPGLEIDVDNVPDQPVDSIRNVVVHAAGCADVMASHQVAGFSWGMAFGEPWASQTLTRGFFAATHSIYMASSHTLEEVTIRVRELVESEFCIGFREGQRIFESIYDAISKGKHVVVLIENISSLSAAFLESAVGQLYRVGIPEAKLEELITWKGVSPSRKILIERAIAEAKESPT